MSRPGRIAKLVPPRVLHAVRRARVNKLIERAIRSGSCWIAAPAGYGKTTALADFLQAKKLTPIWYRVDADDQDVATLFYFLAQSLESATARRALPAFGPEYAEQPQEFARKFFRAFFSQLAKGTILVLDDLHYADTASFRSVLAVLLRELPPGIHCAFLSRTLPGRELHEFIATDQLAVLNQDVLQFSDSEARTLVGKRLRNAARSIDVGSAKGWAAGLVLLSEKGSTASLPAKLKRGARTSDEAAVFTALAAQLFDALPSADKDLLIRLSVLPEITFDLVDGLSSAEGARASLERLIERQLLITRSDSSRAVFRLHDLLREFLKHRIDETYSQEAANELYEKSATLLNGAGYADEAVAIALQGNRWTLAKSLIGARAETILAQGRRLTLIEWCSHLPDDQLDDWLCYWLGVANMSDDAVAEQWLSRAWALFAARGDIRGQALTSARAVLAKTDSWRTHEGLAAWTRRMLELLDRGVDTLKSDEELLVWAGMIRAIDFAEDYRTDTAAARELTRRMFERLAHPLKDDSSTLRLLASESLMEHAGSTGKADIFERAVDSVTADLRDRSVAPWALGVWLVAFGAVSGRYFSYSRRGFPYASAEESLRAAIAIGERESLRGVEFGALYHLQYLMKLRNEFGEFEALITRLGKIADSRFSTQVAVVADCQAALHTVQRNFREAYKDCERFMTTIEAANEPPIERWPHFITQFQVLLADHKPQDAVRFLEERLPLFDGGVRDRMLACIAAARACDAKWCGDDRYDAQLRELFSKLHGANWFAILLNVPSLLAELCADAFEHGIEIDFCRALVSRRSLRPTEQRPRDWPWVFKVHVLGEFRLELNGTRVDLGAKPPTRSLDILRVLAVAKDHTCSLEHLYEWLWPDADGDQAKAACEQALHRLRKLLGTSELIVQREGKLKFALERVWVDVGEWELRLKALTLNEAHFARDLSKLEQLFFDFQGPLLQFERGTAWALPAAERIRSKYIDLALRVGKRLEVLKENKKARTLYLRAIDMYPTSEKCYEALLRLRLSEGDISGAVEDYRRFERVIARGSQAQPSRVIRSLISPHLSQPQH